jgi:RimJ/RimL family protein N-acetyltransferase
MVEIGPVTLDGAHVRLEPLEERHCEELAEAARDGELWKLWYTTVPAPEEMAADIARRLALPTMVPFTVVDKATNRCVGMTTYMNVDRTNQRVEIGSTWYARSVQRTALNTEAKLLLLGHAFDTLGCIAVELRTHVRNEQSRRAIERLGAKQDGILRHHSYAKDGSLRDTVVYSIIAPEWPEVRARLQGMLDSRSK